ncbi:MAG TPA: tetratricopeptide repeat protein [Candidatus Eremiobacteraceae bacterium]
MFALIPLCVAFASASSVAFAHPAPTPAPLASATQAVAAVPRDMAADVTAAKSYMNSGHSTLAVALLLPDHQSDPSNRDVSVALAQAYSYTGKQGEAIQLLDAVLAKDPTDGEARVLLGRSYAYNHDYADAESQFATELKAYPDDSDAQIGLADTFTFQAQYADAEKLYRLVLAKDPKNGDALVGLAAVESYTNRMDSARADYSKVLGAQPDNVDALVGLASVAYWQGDLTTALSIANHAIAISPDNSDAHDLLRQINVRVAPLADLTSVTTTGSDGLQTNRQFIQRFYPTPATYFGVYAARYEIGGSGTSTTANRFGIVAGYAPSAAASFDLRAYSSAFTGQPSTTDVLLSFSGTRRSNDYGASVVVGGVDGSIQANGGVPVVNGQSAIIRLTTLSLNADHRFGNTMAGFGVAHATYNDGNSYNELTLDVNRTMQMNFGASLVADVNFRNAGFAQTWSYWTVNPKPPYNTISHSHGYYDYLSQRDMSAGLTFSEQFNDHLSGGVQAASGTEQTGTFYGAAGPTATFRFEPYLSLDTSRMTFSVDETTVRYSGSSNGFVFPYTANTLQLNVAVRL